MLLHALLATSKSGERDLDAILEALITSQIQLLGIDTEDDSEPQFLQLEVSDSVTALALFTSENTAAQLQSQLVLECVQIDVPGYWPFLEIDDTIALVIDPGQDHNLVLPAEVVASLRPVIQALLENNT